MRKCVNLGGSVSVFGLHASEREVVARCERVSVDSDKVKIRRRWYLH